MWALCPLCRGSSFTSALRAQRFLQGLMPLSVQGKQWRPTVTCGVDVRIRTCYTFIEAARHDTKLIPGTLVERSVCCSTPWAGVVSICDRALSNSTLDWGSNNCSKSYHNCGRRSGRISRPGCAAAARWSCRRRGPSRPRGPGVPVGGSTYELPVQVCRRRLVIHVHVVVRVTRVPPL